MSNKKNIELDGWGDLLNNIENSDSNVYFRSGRLLTAYELQNLFVNNGLAHRICTEIPGDALKKNIILQNDIDNYVYNNIDRLDYKNIFMNCFSLAYAFGGSIAVMDIDDGTESPADPVNLDKIEKINDLVIYDRTRVQILTENFETDTESPDFGKLKYYYVMYEDGSQHKIHVSRCLYFAGDYLPYEKKELNEFWDGSVIQRCYSSLTKIAPAFEYTNKLLKRFNILKFSIKGLSELISTRQSQAVKDRLAIMQQSMNIFNAAVFDPDGESITSETITLQGIPDVLKQFMIMFSAESGIPVNRLFSKLFGGIGGEGDGDENRYYDMVQREAERVLTKPLNKLIQYICLQKDSPVNYNEIGWEFAPLIQQSAKDISEVETKTVESVVKLYEMNLITQEEARETISKLQNIQIDLDTKMNNQDGAE